MDYKYHVFTHRRTKMPQIVAGDLTICREDLEVMLESQGEPIFLIVKGEIEGNKKTRKRGIWTGAKGNVIYFTCPWCGSVQKTGRKYVGRDNYESIWCGYGDQSGCHRHLMCFYVKDPNDERLVYLDKPPDS